MGFDTVFYGKKEWSFWREKEDGSQQDCKCIYCGKTGEFGIYPGWYFYEKDYFMHPVNFKQEYQKFMTWCASGNEPDYEDFFILFMISYHDGQFGGLD